MKNKTIYLILFGLIISCKNEKLNISKKENSFLGAPPTSQPTFTGILKNQVDQWKRLSLGFTSLLNNPLTCNTADLRIIINNKVASNQERPIRNFGLYNTLLNSSFNFDVPFSGNYDLYDAIANQINNITPITSIATWDNTFFGAFTHNWGLGLDPYFVTITLPSRELQITSGNLAKPALVCPDPESFGFPMVAYGFVAGSITELTILDEDFYDDLIESGNYLIFSLQYDYDYIDEKEITGNCEGGYVLNDNICDGKCGENATNSSNDCGDHNKNKVVYLRQIRINEDIANRNASITNETKHWESWSPGCYEPGFSCWTLQTNGHFEAIKKNALEGIKYIHVKRTRIRKSGLLGPVTVSNGVSDVQDACSKNGNDKNEVIVSNHYNPVLSNIYIFFYENDFLRRQKQFSDVPLIYNSTTFDYLRWTGDRGNLTAGKYNSTMWSGYILLNKQRPAAANFRNLISPIIPPGNPIWVSNTYNGQNVMEYNYTDTTNKINYLLYYLVNKREW